MLTRVRANSTDRSKRANTLEVMPQNLLRQSSNMEISNTTPSNQFEEYGSNSIIIKITSDFETNEEISLTVPDLRSGCIKSKSEENEDDFQNYTWKAKRIIEELIETERNYVQILKEVVEGYFDYMEAGKKTPPSEGVVKMPKDLRGGKDRIIFGNVKEIFEFHSRELLVEFEKCKDDVTHLLNLFMSRKDHLKIKYGKFCMNNPKSEHIISQHNDYFTLIRMSKDYRHTLKAQLMAPVQRVTRYPLLLQEIGKMFHKAGDAEKQAIVEKALNIAKEIAEYANYMIEAGRITGFEGDVTCQGLLLMCGEEICFKQRKAFKKPKMNQVKAREVECSIEVGSRFMLERYDGDRDKSVFMEGSKSKNEKSDGNCIIIQCPTKEKRNQWLNLINSQIRGLQSFTTPLENF